MSATIGLKQKSGYSTYKLYTLILVLSPILRQYKSGIPGVTLAELTLGITSLLVFGKGFKISLNKALPLIYLWFIGVFLSLNSYFFQQCIYFESVSRLIRFSFYVFLVVIATNCFQLSYALKILKILSIAVSIYIIGQTIVYNILGVILPFKILLFPLWNDIDTGYMLNFASKYYFRPSGVFVEPGYAAQFLLPSLAFSLFGWRNEEKVDYKCVVLIFTAMILTTSAQGIFLGMFVLGVFLMYKIRKNEKFTGVYEKLLLIALILILLVAFFSLDYIQLAINKVTGEVRAGSSFALRVYRGFAVFAQLPVIYKIVGVGHGNMGNFVLANDIITKYDSAKTTLDYADYSSGLSTVLVSYGIIGFLFLIAMYISLVRNTKGAFRLIGMTFIIMSFVANISFSVLIVFYLSLIYSGYTDRNVKLHNSKVVLL